MEAVNQVMSPYVSPQGSFVNNAGVEMDIAIGEEEKRKVRAPPRVLWIPVSDDGYHGATEQPDDAHAVYETWTRLTVIVWGRNLDEAERLRSAVLTKSFDTYSAGAFKPIGGGKYSKGLSTADRGVSITFQVAFKLLIIDEAFPQTTVTTVTYPLLATLPDGDPTTTESFPT